VPIQLSEYAVGETGPEACQIMVIFVGDAISYLLFVTHWKTHFTVLAYTNQSKTLLWENFTGSYLPISLSHVVAHFKTSD